MATTFVGHRVGAIAVPVRRQPLRLPLPLLILWWLLRFVIRLLVIIARSPVAMFFTTLAVLGLVAERWYGIAGVMAGYCWLTAAGLLLWFYWRPFGRFLRVRWRRWSIYRYKWRATMDFADLDRYRSDGRQYAPVLGKVTCTQTVDVVRARMLAGQVVEDWAKVSGRLCQTFGAIDCRVRSVPGRPHDVELSFLIDDPLARVVEPCYATNDLAALPVALQEDGEWYKLPLLGNHLLLTGATNAGKSKALWAIINQLRSNICDGTCEIWGLDPKGGMELAFGEAMFTRFVYGETDSGKGFEAEFAEVLEDAVLVMRKRQSALRGVTQTHVPTPGEPLIVIVIDELAALTGYVNDRDVKRRIANALSLLLSQGRAVGVTVLAAIQDPRKETLPARDLFPVRILLRVTEAEHVHLVFGPGARDKGAKADEIQYSLPGVAFVQVDGVAEAVRVRFAYISKDYIGVYFRPPLAIAPEPPEELAA
jgi:S-DNA-T family DNA segregation ATPase FtsK/SpoIIIE